MFIIKKLDGGLKVLDGVMGVDFTPPHKATFLLKNGEAMTFNLQCETSEYIEDALIRGFKTNEYFKEVESV